MSITGAVQPPPFTADALCSQVDPDLFYPEKGSSSKGAKRTCAVCPVRPECLRWALKTQQQWGVWGGLSARERRKLSKKAA
jgi:WhiB family redox-sensing transcriptional regulator